MQSVRALYLPVSTKTYRLATYRSFIMPLAQLQSYGIALCQLFVTIQMYSPVTSGLPTVSTIRNLRMRHAKVTRDRVKLTVLPERESLGKIKLRGGVMLHSSPALSVCEWSASN
jgi:hypothetical protein